MIIHTLIELLVIIAIIAILAELVETTVGAVYADSAYRSTEAKAMLAQKQVTSHNLSLKSSFRRSSYNE